MNDDPHKRIHEILSKIESTSGLHNLIKLANELADAIESLPPVAPLDQIILNALMTNGGAYKPPEPDNLKIEIRVNSLIQMGVNPLDIN